MPAKVHGYAMDTRTSVGLLSRGPSPTVQMGVPGHQVLLRDVGPFWLMAVCPHPGLRSSFVQIVADTCLPLRSPAVRTQPPGLRGGWGFPLRRGPTP